VLIYQITFNNASASSRIALQAPMPKKLSTQAHLRLDSASQTSFWRISPHLMNDSMSVGGAAGGDGLGRRGCDWERVRLDDVENLTEFKQ
jgi:hypothetical protein